MADPFISAAQDARIEAKLARAFATRKVLGWTADLVFERDTSGTGEPEEIAVSDVLISFAAREPARSARNAASFMGADGQLEHEAPFPVRRDDTFRLPATAPETRGPAGVITMVYPAKGGVVRALFTLRG